MAAYSALPACLVLALESVQIGATENAHRERWNTKLAARAEATDKTVNVTCIATQCVVRVQVLYVRIVLS